METYQKPNLTPCMCFRLANITRIHHAYWKFIVIKWPNIYFMIKWSLRKHWWSPTGDHLWRGLTLSPPISNHKSISCCWWETGKSISSVFWPKMLYYSTAQQLSGVVEPETYWETKWRLTQVWHHTQDLYWLYNAWVGKKTKKKKTFTIPAPWEIPNGQTTPAHQPDR